MSLHATSRRPARCDVAVETSDPALPVAGTGSLAAVRKSRRAKWRAATLVALHLVIAAHVTHFLVARRTLSPVEPSEAMYTFELGRVNAGFIFLLAALLATVVFGRFVCGWGCHLVALQDLCAWLMKRLGIRPRPFRSRLLLWVPLGLAFYMFVWPSLRPWLLGVPRTFPGFSDGLITTDFWATFPGPLFAGLTFLTCGFAAVYFLGAKGFCTYGCPYGALFVWADRLSPGRIVVSDACEQCGHCTVTCTSNVLVHEEVRRFGQVVDPGCMKCMDCVSVCPKGALRFAFGVPSLFKRAAAGARGRTYSLGWGEEFGLLSIGVGATLAFRGLYDGPPLLMAVGLGGISAFVALELWRLARRPAVRLQNLSLKQAGRLAPAGLVFAACAALWLTFTAHSASVQWLRARGASWIGRAGLARAELLAGPARSGLVSESARHAADRALFHFALADRLGLFGVVEIKLGLAWSHLARGEDASAEAALRAAIALSPTRPPLHDHLIDFLVLRHRAPEAIAALEAKLAAVGSSAPDEARLGGALVEADRLDEAVAAYRRAIDLEPQAYDTRYDLGGVLRRLGRPAEAIAELSEAARLAPADSDVQIELGLAYQAVGQSAAAVTCFRRAIELDPTSPESLLHLPGLIETLEAAPR